MEFNVCIVYTVGWAGRYSIVSVLVEMREQIFLNQQVIDPLPPSCCPFCLLVTKMLPEIFVTGQLSVHYDGNCHSSQHLTTEKILQKHQPECLFKE